MIVFLLAPVIRTMARMLLPSTIMPRIWARRSVVSLFMHRTLPRRLAKHKGNFDDTSQFSLVPAESPGYLDVMRIVFAADELALIETDEAGATRLSVAVIKSAR